MALELRSYNLRQSRMEFLPQRSYKRRRSNLNMAVNSNQKDTTKIICFGTQKDIQ